jgi:hypothetical protein
MRFIHYAKLDNSARLQRVHRLLSDGEWHGTREIIQRANVCAVNTACAELRANGLMVSTRCIGRGLYEYRLDQ